MLNKCKFLWVKERERNLSKQFQWPHALSMKVNKHNFGECVAQQEQHVKWHWTLGK